MWGRGGRDVDCVAPCLLLSRRGATSASHHSVDTVDKTVAELRETGKEEEVARVELLEVSVGSRV